MTSKAERDAIDVAVRAELRWLLRRTWTHGVTAFHVRYFRARDEEQTPGIAGLSLHDVELSLKRMRYRRTVTATRPRGLGEPLTWSIR
jgi:hypothetical protein